MKEFGKSEYIKGFNPDTAFAVDAMLGRLARWLRILGYDTFYRPHIKDSELVRISRLEERVIITRDSLLARRKNLQPLIFIKSQRLKEQIIEVLQWLRDMGGYSRTEKFSRCPLCNGILEKVKKEEVHGRVPEYVYIRNKDFYSCRDCGGIYWHGTHVSSMLSIISELMQGK